MELRKKIFFCAIVNPISDNDDSIDPIVVGQIVQLGYHNIFPITDTYMIETQPIPLLVDLYHVLNGVQQIE